MKRILLGAAGAAGLLFGAPAGAQTYQDSGGTYVRGVVPIQPGVGPLFTASNPGKISGSFSASLSGFQPTPAYSQLSVGATSSRASLPSGSVVIVYNTGANAAFVTLGGSTATATVSNDVIPAGGWMAFTVGPSTFLAAIETAGTTSLNISGGSGMPTGAGGGGGGGGGGSNASVGAIGSPAPGSATYNGVLVAGGNIVGASGSAWGSAPTGLNVLGVNANVLASALPAGAATAANQTAVQGAFGSSIPSVGTALAARAQNTEPTSNANGQSTALAVGLEGKLIALPYANKENMVRGSASQTGTSATTVIGTQGSGIKIYVTGVQCKNTGSTTAVVTLNDSAASVLIVPTAGGDNEVYETPLVVAANTALTFTPSASSSTIYCNAQGYSGS
jgi:hypothetical protein